MDGVRIWLRRAVCAVALVAAIGIVLAGDVVAQNELQAGTDEATSEATYYGAVQDVLTRNCVGCHSENAASLGGITPPMELTSYEVARRWASRIATAVQGKYMPPWDADEQHEGVFKDERYISDEDKQTLIGWAEAGAPMGDPSEAVAVVSSADVVTRAAEVAADGSLWRAGIPDVTFGFRGAGARLRGGRGLAAAASDAGGRRRDHRAQVDSLHGDQHRSERAPYGVQPPGRGACRVAVPSSSPRAGVSC